MIRMMKGLTYPRRGLHGEVVHLVGARIVRGDFPPGEPLPPEDELAAALGASRTVLREAVKVLAAKGLVAARPKTGTRVRPRADWNLMDPDVLAWQLEAGPGEAFFRNVAEVRRAIEPAAARLAARRATPGELARLGAHLGAMREGVDDADAYIAADLLFHAAILGASHNELLEQLGGTMRAVFRASRDVSTRVPGSSAEAMPLHEAVLHAIHDGDGDAAEAAMLALIDRTAADVARALAQG